MIDLSLLRRELSPSQDQEEYLTDIRDEVVALFEEVTGGLWNARTSYVEEFRFEARRIRSFWPKLRPVTTVTSLKWKWDRDDDYEDVDADEYERVDDRFIREHSRNRDAFWYPYVQLTYDGGYTETTCPADIRRACVLQAKFMTARNSDGRLITKSQNFEGGAGVYEENWLHPFFKRITKQKVRAQV